MASFHFNFFQASTPRLADHLIPTHGSAEAVDCKFHSGELDCWREPKPVASVPAGTLRVHRVGCCWLPFDSCVDLCDGPILCNDFYVTGRNTYPEVGSVGADCVPVYSRLGVPCPEFKLSAIATSAAANKDLLSTSFSYQYVNARGKVGQPAPGGELIQFNEGTPVVLSGWAIPDPSWQVTHVRLSVLVSGHEAGKEATNALDTSSLIIADVPINAPSYTFNQFFEELDDAVQEDFVRPPPEDLKGICRISSMNCLAGFSGRRVYFSHTNNQDDWPYFMEVEDTIKAITESGNNIYVATLGRPAVIQGDADCKTAGCRSVINHQEAFPMVNSTMVSMPHGAGYAGRDGFVVMSGNKTPKLLTWQTYAPEDWHEYPPNKVFPVYSNSYLYLFGERRSSVMQLAGLEHEGWSADAHSWLSDRVTYALNGGDGELYMLKGTQLERWNAGTALRPHKWVSPEIVSGTVKNFRAAYMHISRGPEQFVMRVDDRIIESRAVTKPQDFVLPAWGSGYRFQVTLIGTAKVRLVSVGTSYKELTA
jgi:hypothetical protein